MRLQNVFVNCQTMSASLNVIRAKWPCSDSLSTVPGVCVPPLLLSHGTIPLNGETVANQRIDKTAQILW
jgi:hypothetical protein